MEKSNEITYHVCQFASILLPVFGYGLSAKWWGVIIILTIIPFGWILRRIQTKIFSWITLVIFVGIAAYGLLSSVSPHLMVAGVSAALACWELEDQIPNSIKSSTSSITDSCEKYHLKILGIAITTGLIVAEAGLFLKLSLPFDAVFLAAILVSFCIFQLFSLFKRT